MVLPDVNVLVNAFRTVAPDHAANRDWLETAVADESAFGLSEFVLSCFLRIATNPRIFVPTAPFEAALDFAETLRSQPNCILVSPGPRHWAIFARLCRETGARGNLIPDAYLAALAIESGCELVSADRDFARFAGLQWRLPF